MAENNISTDDRFNNERSNTYDELIAKVIPGYNESHELARYLLEDSLQSSSKVLVAGCGTGREIIDYSVNNLDWQVIGFDPSEKMLSMAREKLKDNSCEERARLVTGEIDDVHETDFDAATAILVLQFLPNMEEIQRFLNNVSSKLKSGSPFIVLYMGGTKDIHDYAVLHSAWKTQQFKTRNDDQAVNDEFRQRDKETGVISQEQIELYLGKAGFSNPVKFFQAYLLTGQIAFKK